VQKIRLVVCLVVVAGCSDGPTAPQTVGEPGSLSFAFTGAAGAATFTASGAVPSNHTTTLGTSSWAAAEQNDTTQTLAVLASAPRTRQTWDLVSVEFPRLSLGTENINPTCGGISCAEILVLFSSRIDDGGFQYVCTLDSGSITLAAISATRASGSFSGTGSCFSSVDVQTPFTIANGTFDVGILTTGITTQAHLP
jgi:hypothetical protein